MRAMREWSCLCLVLGLALLWQSAVADSDCQEASADCVAVGHWNFSVVLGAGVRTNPLVDGKDIPLVVVPQISYYGKRFFLDNLDLGFTLLEKGESTLSFVGSPGYDRVYFYRDDLQNIFLNGLPTDSASGSDISRTAFPPRSRGVTYLAGPEWTFKTHGISGQLDVLHDLTGHDHGTEVRAALGIPLIEAHGKLTADVGLTWKSASIVNYYYGAPGIYEGSAAFDPFVKLGYVRPLSRKWRLTALLQCERLGDSIANSPIVAEHYVETAFIGATYTY